MDLLFQSILLLIFLVATYYFIFAKSLKISEQTSTKLTLNIRPRLFLGTGIFVSPLFIFLLFATILFTPITQLVCNRSPNYTSISNLGLIAGQSNLTVMCNLIEKDWFGQKKNGVQIFDLLEAKLETEMEIDSLGKPIRIYKILLLNDKDSFPFTRKTYTKFQLEQLQSIVLKINDFLTNPLEKNLAVILDDTCIGYIILIITLFCGLLTLLVASAGLFITCHFDKETNTVKLSRYRWFGILGKTVFQYSLNEITAVKLEKIDTSIDEHFFQVILVLESGENLQLTPNYTPKHINADFIFRVTKNFLELK
jgi:hypothetical protein